MSISSISLNLFHCDMIPIMYGIVYGHYALFHWVNTFSWLQSEYIVVYLEKKVAENFTPGTENQSQGVAFRYALQFFSRQSRQLPRHTVKSIFFSAWRKVIYRFAWYFLCHLFCKNCD